MSADNFDKTTFFRPEIKIAATSVRLTIFDGTTEPVEVDLAGFGKDMISFGRSDQCDIVIRSNYVSRRHGCFRLVDGGWIIENDPESTNGIIFSGEAIQDKRLEDGDHIRIDDGVETTKDGVLLVFSIGASDVKWQTFDISGSVEITIGRGDECIIKLDHISVSNLHAKIILLDGSFYLVDSGSTNGVIINGKRVSGKVRLNEKDLILITNSKLIFTNEKISYCCYKKGISVEGFNVTKEVGKGKVICNNVDLTINPCEMVAIVGGSGAGKTTVMNCLSGYSQPTGGSVAVNGLDLYENFSALKNIIGYVPQSDIVYDNLTVADMLNYAAQLRLPMDISQGERTATIDEAIKIVELTPHKNTLIRSLSGGQRKRASIAVELLSDPNLFFLDEPASGLDPGTERNLLMTLKNMAVNGKTVIFVTHSTLNLHLCDKIVFMGTGGNLCFYGSINEALAFFEVDDIVDVYNLLYHEPEKWKEKYNTTQNASQAKKALPQNNSKESSKKERINQAFVLSKRHLNLLINDKVRLALLLFQAPLLALLISLVANGYQFDDYVITRNLLFALSCSAFWIGILNSIQEVCKERNILKREYMTGLRLDSYIVSKTLVMAIVCAVQTLLLLTVFTWTIGLPEVGVFGNQPFIEMMITAFLTALSSSAIGIFVSSLFKNADRAMTVAPLLLLPQLLFSGLIFELSGITWLISFGAIARWAMQGFGTIANLNTLDIITSEGLRIPSEFEAAYEFTRGSLASTWAIMLFIIMSFATLAGLVLRNINRER